MNVINSDERLKRLNLINYYIPQDVDAITGLRKNLEKNTSNTSGKILFFYVNYDVNTKKINVQKDNYCHCIQVGSSEVNGITRLYF